MLKKIVLAVAGLLVAAVVAVLALTLARWDRTFEAPDTGLAASTDPAVIARGKYLGEGPAHCTGCHVPPSMNERVREGEVPELVGGREFRIPPGVIRSPNITPDPDTGIGRFSDAQLLRALRHGVRHDGRALLPFMPFQNLSDDDLVAVVSWMRSRRPVKNAVPDHDFNLLGKAVLAFVIQPEGPAAPPPKSVTPAATVEYGRYLVHSVANCYGCHTDRDLRTGKYIGQPFAGGHTFASETDPAFQVVPPNITPDPKTGRLAIYSEDAWVARFKNVSRQPDHTPMPWINYRNMPDDDLRAIHRYLKTVPPVERDVGDPIRRKI